MRILCVGGGPAGLDLAILAERRRPGHEIAVVERNPAGGTHGWGVVFRDDLLDGLFRNDPDRARAVRREMSTARRVPRARHRGELTVARTGGGP